MKFLLALTEKGTRHDHLPTDRRLHTLQTLKACDLLRGEGRRGRVMEGPRELWWTHLIGGLETLHGPLQTLIDGLGGLRVEIVDRQETIFGLFALLLGRHFIFEQEIGMGFHVGRGDVANC